MTPPIGLENCLSFINCQLQPPKTSEGHHAVVEKRAITISRLTGSGGHSVAEKLQELLQAQTSSDERPWTVFDRNLVEKVLEDHNLPKHLARFMKEDRIPEISDTMDELFGLHPSSWTLVHKVAETILHLVDLGHVIIVGRGGALVTHRLKHVFHVRLVGSLEHRVSRVEQAEHLTREKAMALVRREDSGRARFLKKYFNQDINDPLLYHLVINTDLVTYEEAARMILQAVQPHPLAEPSTAERY